MTYREGAHGLPGGDRVQCRQSSDRGATWQPWPGFTADPPLRLFRARLRDGTLISHRYELELGKGADSQAYILLSKDDGCTWKRQPAPVADLPFDPKRFLGLWGRVTELPEGRLLCTLYGYKPEARKFALGVVESTDGGLNWRYLSTMCDDPGIGPEGPDEADLALLESGRLLSVFRTGGNLFQVTSSDGGRTWSAPRNLGTFGVSPQLLLLDNGVLVLTYGTRHVSTQCSLIHESTRDMAYYRYEWSYHCDTCPLQSKCTAAKSGRRLLSVGLYHDLLQARPREMKTDEFKARMKQRAAIEGTNSELKRKYGLGRSRYRGLMKTTLANCCIGAACNTSRWFRRLMWESDQEAILA